MQCRNAEDLPKYKQELQNLKAGGSTNFVDCFKFIEKYVKTKAGLGDISVIFFTDGQDTCNDRKAINASMEEMKKTINKREITSRFLTIGFTKDHDAAFLNNIAQAGSDLGNFFFIDTDNTNYDEQIQECLQSSLQMAAQEEEGLILRFSSQKSKMVNRKIALPKMLEAVDDDADDEDPQGGRIKKDLEEVKIHDLLYDFTQTVFFKEDEFDDISGYLEFPGGIQGTIHIEKALVTDPSPEVVAKASVQLINKLIFDAIQEAQLDKRKRSNMELYEYVKDLDKELDEYATLAFKIRDRDLKSSILQDIQECKNKTLNFMEVLRSTQGKIPNA